MIVTQIQTKTHELQEKMDPHNCTDKKSSECKDIASAGVDLLMRFNVRVMSNFKHKYHINLMTQNINISFNTIFRLADTGLDIIEILSVDKMCIRLQNSLV